MWYCKSSSCACTYSHPCMHTHTHTHKPKQSPDTWRRQKRHIVFSWMLEVAPCQSAYCNVWVFAAARRGNSGQKTEENTTTRQSVVNVGHLWFSSCPYRKTSFSQWHSRVASSEKKWWALNDLMSFLYYGIQSGNGYQSNSKYLPMLRLLSRKHRTTKNCQMKHCWLSKQMYCMKTDKIPGIFSLHY